MIRIPDDRPKGWESPDGRSYWWHYAHEQDRQHRGKGQPEWWRLLAVVGLLALAVYLLARDGPYHLLP
jgi:hypothetical protein